MARSIVRHEVFHDLADFYWNELFTDTQMQKVRCKVSKWIQINLPA